jgi:hypothetical protein
MTKAELIREMKLATAACEKLAAEIIGQREAMAALLDSIEALNVKCNEHIDRLEALRCPDDFDLDNAPEGIDLDDADWWKNGPAEAGD